MLRHVYWRHVEGICLDLERLLAAEKGLPRQRIDLGDLLIGHGVTTARGAVAMDHEEGP